MVNQLINAFKNLPQVEAIALGGSRSGTNFDNNSDYDIYLYITDPIPESVRQEIYEKYCSTVEIGNHFWEYEDNGRLLDGIDFDILYRNLDDFSAGIKDVVERHQAHNGYTTCMWHNLLTCKILYDRDGRLTIAKNRFNVPYPSALKANIINRNHKLLTGTFPCYQDQIEKAVKRGDLISINHRVAAFLESYFDILFALNEQTHPGEKRLISLCMERCNLLPAHFEENLKSLFDDRENTCDVIRRIIAELEKIL